jgi:hypothetical protein|tara:strand:- start:3977 stop:4306 length:330 start_codon:yes stop_codon:yes gene_type:complete
MATGPNKYSAQEAANLEIGQAGFDVVAEHDSNSQTPDHSGSWIALQCVAAVTPGSTAYSAQFVQLVSATSNVGDNLGAVFLQPGDIIYGNFSAVVNHTNSNATLIAYRG